MQHLARLLSLFLCVISFYKWTQCARKTHHSDVGGVKRHKLKHKYNLTNVFDQLQPEVAKYRENKTESKKFDILQQVYNRLANSRNGGPQYINIPGAVHVYGPPPKVPAAEEPFHVIATPQLTKLHSYHSLAWNPHRNFPNYFQQFSNKPLQRFVSDYQNRLYLPQGKRLRDFSYPENRFIPHDTLGQVPMSSAFHGNEQTLNRFSNRLPHRNMGLMTMNPQNFLPQNIEPNVEQSSISSLNANIEGMTEGTNSMMNQFNLNRISPEVGEQTDFSSSEQPSIITSDQHIFHAETPIQKFFPEREVTISSPEVSLFKNQPDEREQQILEDTHSTLPQQSIVNLENTESHLPKIDHFYHTHHFKHHWRKHIFIYKYKSYI